MLDSYASIHELTLKILFLQGPTRIPKQFEAIVAIGTELTEIS
jgi:hypothetical protein